MKKKKILLILLIIIIIPVIFVIATADNKTLEYSYYDFGEGNNDIKIMQLSDMHFPKCYVDTDNIVNKIDEENIDIIAITGDYLDSKQQLETTGALEFLDKIKDKAHIFYVSGNHEWFNDEYFHLVSISKKYNVTVLNNEYKVLNIRGTDVAILGIPDGKEFEPDKFNGLDTSVYKVLLAHRPELFDSYSAKKSFNPDLVLSGHAHGGQIRVFNQGLVAPDQGLFPKYDHGLYQANNTRMVLSRGIGNSILPLRINDKPEAPIITLHL
ncbi:MAG: metallophosphoesterase [Acholeplasmatales bacterium]|nr:metallophosphoesterase [Acholeplasmatales bacterium]